MDLLYGHYRKISFSKSAITDQVEEMNIGHQLFGQNFITPLPERIAFQEKSEFTFHSLKVEEQVVGYISMFRFLNDFLDDLLTGRRRENEITVQNIQPFVRFEAFSIYIDVIAINPILSSHLRRFYAGIMVICFSNIILGLLSKGYQITSLYAVSATQEGDQLIRKLGFRLLEDRSTVPGRLAYECPIDDYTIHKFRSIGNKWGLDNLIL